MHPTARSTPPLWQIALAFATMYVTWGTTYLAIKYGVRDEALPPFLFGGFRILAAGLLLSAWLVLRGRWTWPRADELPGMIGVAALLFVAGNGLITVAEITVDSGAAAVLAATTPLWMGLFGMLLVGSEKLTVRGWLGLLIGLGGVLVLLSPRLSDPAAFFRDAGPFLVLGSAASWALGSLLLRRQVHRGDHFVVAAQQMLLGGIGLILLGLAVGETRDLPATITPGAIGAFLYLLVVGSLFGFVAFNWLLVHVSPSKVGTYAYVNPAVAVLVGWAFGEDITWPILAGIAIILLGVFLIRRGDKPVRVPLTDAPARPLEESCPVLLPRPVAAACRPEG